MHTVDPRQKAREIAGKFDCRDNEELLEKIFDAYKIDLDYWPFQDGFSGMLWFPMTHKPTIVVNTKDSLDKQRYTKARELARFFLGYENCNKAQAELFAEELAC